MRILRHEDKLALIFTDAVLSYPSVIEPSLNTVDPNPKNHFLEYTSDVLIPKDQVNMEEFEAVIQDAKYKKWKENVPKFRYEYLKDGDEKRDKKGKPVPTYAGMYFVTVKTKEDRPPMVIDMAKNELTKADDIVGGDICHVFAEVYAYDTAGNRGVSFGLKTVKLKEKASEPFGGGVSSGAVLDALDEIDGDDYSV